VNGGRGVFIHTDVLSKDSVEQLIAHSIESLGTSTSWSTTLRQVHHSGFRPNLKRFPSRDGCLFLCRAMVDAGGLRRCERKAGPSSTCALNAQCAPVLRRLQHLKALRALTFQRVNGQHSITVNAICPAAVTPAYERFRAVAPELAKQMLEQNPMGYMGDAEQDIGGVAAFLASDDARYLTGNTLFVDGGGHINGVQWAPPLPPE
jgi:hypothetical protein